MVRATGDPGAAHCQAHTGKNRIGPPPPRATTAAAARPHAS